MVSLRALEALTSLITGGFGIAVVVSSLDNGIGWGRSGVDSGTFPFMTGIIIALGSLYNLARGLLAGRDSVIGGRDLARVGALFLPAAAFVVAIPLLGLYAVTAIYMFGTLRLQNRVASWRAGLIALGVVAGLYLVFEKAFQVELPHGWLGGWLGW